MWSFIQDKILGMKWLNELIGKVLTNFGFDMASKLGGSLQFFIYEVSRALNLKYKG
ncbi:hypothetical protein [Campylobacter ureolyticus]|uniref:hypothetical protein n=1 Tax=Campylobacter ureolyticus TaxID=827 RepID=UPI0022B45210|nr:hypothetical protein [Campylobacter ureolyticus]MCZ6103664.1 hypothetical protein [Campylobacter ureolyticus]